MGLPRVRLTNESGNSVEASVVYLWNRDEQIAGTDAPTFRNMALMIFNAQPLAARVALCSTTNKGTIFLIFEAAHRWFDVTGKPIGMKGASA